MARLNDLIDSEAGIAAIARAAAESGDPREIVATQARITRSILEHCGDIVHALVTGAAAEPELAAVLAEGQRRHVEGAAQVAGLLREHGAPRANADTLASVSDIRFVLVLREDYGWSLDRIEDWIAETSRRLLWVDRARQANVNGLLGRAAGRPAAARGRTCKTTPSPAFECTLFLQTRKNVHTGGIGGVGLHAVPRTARNVPTPRSPAADCTLRSQMDHFVHNRPRRRSQIARNSPANADLAAPPPSRS